MDLINLLKTQNDNLQKELSSIKNTHIVVAAPAAPAAPVAPVAPIAPKPST